jgi:hypothetical protein
LPGRGLIKIEDWLLFAAAIVTDPNVRGSIIDQVVRYNSQSLLGANQPFPVIYNSSTGEQGPVGQGSPAVGAMFAPLAMRLEKKFIAPNNSSDGGQTGNNSDGQGSTGRDRHIASGAIVGAAVGGVALFAGLILLGVFFYRRRANNRWGKEDSAISLDIDPKPFDLSTQEYEAQPLNLMYQSGDGKLPPFGRTNGAFHLSDTPSPDSNASFGGGPSHNPPTSTGTQSLGGISGSSVIREETRGATFDQDSRILSEMSRIREEIAGMRTAVEQGQMPPPGYYEELMERAETGLFSHPQDQVRLQS